MRGKYTGGLDCLFKIVKNESPFALYKGVSTAIVSKCGTLAMIFGFDSFFKKLILTYSDFRDPLPYKILFLTSFLAC